MAGIGRRAGVRGAATAGNRDPARPAFGQRSTDAARPVTGRQGLVGVGAVVAVVGAMVFLSVVSTPSSASRPELFAGSIALDNVRGQPVVIDLATGALTTRFTELAAYVDPEMRSVRAVPVLDGTLLVSERGMINFLGLDNYLVRKESGVLLARNLTGARALASGTEAYVVAQHGDAVHVALVDRSTVETNKTKGSLELAGTIDPRDAGYATAGGHLWFVRDGERLVEVRPASGAQRTLAAIDRAHVGPGAVLAAGGGAEPTAVVVAESGRLRLFDPSGDAPVVEVPSGVANATSLVPTTGSDAVVWFLYEDASGWLTVGLDTATGRRVGPHRVTGADLTAAPVPPAYSRGKLYTLDGRTTGADGETPVLLAIDPFTGIAQPITDSKGAPVAYALKDEIERVDFAPTQVIARGPRVVFNNRFAFLAYVVFSDGTHPPALVDKTDTRNEFDPTKSPSELVSPPARRDDPSTPTTVVDAPPAHAPDPPASTRAVIDEALDCAAEGQKPHVPLITSAAPMPRAVTLTWLYRTLDTRDCVPSTYVVSVRPLNGARPVSDAYRQVDGQMQITFDGLRPNSTYEFVVTARIGDAETASPPYVVTTLPTGPERPISVSVTADPAKGAWRVSWTSCDHTCDVPVAAWAVEASELCGAGNAAALPRVETAGSARVVDIPYTGSYGDLTGRSLRFEVYGRAADGINGDAASSQCVEGWRNPALDKLQFSASLTGANDDGTIGALLALHVNGNPLSVLGSEDVRLTFSVDGATVATHGFSARGRHEVPVTASARRSHSAAVSIASHGRTWNLPPQHFEDHVPWADVTLHALARTTDNPNVGVVHATASRLREKAPGSTVVASGSLVCGSRAAPAFVDRPVAPDGTFTLENIDLVDLGGQCELAVSFREPAEPAFHAGPSPVVRGAVDLGSPRPHHEVGGFGATWLAPGGPLVVEGNPSAFGGELTITYTTRGDRGGPCSAEYAVPPAPSVYVEVAPTCFAALTAGRQGHVRVRGYVTVSRRYLGQSTSVEFDAPDTILRGDVEEPTPSTHTTTSEPPPPPTSAGLAVAGRLQSHLTRSRPRKTDV